MAIGVNARGDLPLPWLEEPLARARALDGSHALLVHGPAGAGQLELALLLAQSLLCEATPRAALACGHCGACALVRCRAHTDLLVAVPDALRVQLGWVGDDEGKLSKSDAKPSRDLRVEQVRQAIAWSQQTSGRGRGKVLVLHPADALNATAANALLKTLEEPPGNLHIVLTSTDPERLLPTVRSRCQRLPLPSPSAEVARAWLAAQGLTEPDSVLAATGGSPLEALAWANEGLNAETLGRLPRQVAAGDPSAFMGRPLPRSIDLLLKINHDALARCAGGAPRFFPSADWPDGADLTRLVAWQHALLRAARHDDHPWNAGLLAESLVLQGAAAWAHAAASRGGSRQIAGPRPGASLHSDG